MKTAIIILGLVALAAAAPKVKPRIINGTEAIPHSIPYQVLLQFYNGTVFMECGGALISENYILTAAHCCNGSIYADVLLGAHDFSKFEDVWVHVNVTEMISHEGYHQNPMVNDICAAKLPEPVTLSDAIKPIPIATGDDDFAGKIATASGWGEIDGVTHESSDVLLKVDLEVISTEECQKEFSSVTSSVVCTSGKNGGGTCHGDSGGPLVADGLLIGLSSFSLLECTAGHASAFTRVSSFVDWIKENTDLQ